MVVVIRADRDRCQLCRSQLEKAGFVVEDDARVRKFVCAAHLTEMLNARLMTLRTINHES
jgi:hypothetical protein